MNVILVSGKLAKGKAAALPVFLLLLAMVFTYLPLFHAADISRS